MPEEEFCSLFAKCGLGYDMQDQVLLQGKDRALRWPIERMKLRFRVSHLHRMTRENG